MISYETRIGTVSFSNNYFAKLIGEAVSSCYGVAGMAPQGSKQKLFGLLKGKIVPDMGVKVRGDINSITVDLHILVVYGMNINAIAKSITHKVKYTVMEATGISVKKVTVRVDGIVD